MSPSEDAINNPASRGKIPDAAPAPLVENRREACYSEFVPPSAPRRVLLTKASSFYQG